MLVGVILCAAGLGPLQVASERPDASLSLSPSATLLRQRDRKIFGAALSTALAQTSEKQEYLSKGKELAEPDAKEVPLELSYPDYNHYGTEVTNKADEIHQKVISTLDRLAHEAKMKSQKYGYGLEGLAGGVRDLQTSVQQYKKRMHTNWNDETDSMKLALDAGKVWKPEAFEHDMPEGLWHDGLLEALGDESVDHETPLEGAKRRWAGGAVGQASANEFIHPDTTDIYKMGYSHGFKNASFGESNGVELAMEPKDNIPQAYYWTRRGANWADRVFTGRYEKIRPHQSGWLTQEQKKVIESEEGPNIDVDKAHREGYLKKEPPGSILPYTWTTNGQLWALEHGIFKGPPPDVHSWVTKPQMETIAAWEGASPWKPDDPEDGVKKTLFRAEETDAQGRSQQRARTIEELGNKRIGKQWRNKHGMPLGYERMFDSNTKDLRGSRGGREGEEEEYEVDGSEDDGARAPVPQGEREEEEREIDGSDDGSEVHEYGNDGSRGEEDDEDSHHTEDDEFGREDLYGTPGYDESGYPRI